MHGRRPLRGVGAELVDRPPPGYAAPRRRAPAKVLNRPSASGIPTRSVGRRRPARSRRTGRHRAAQLRREPVAQVGAGGGVGEDVARPSRRPGPARRPRRCGARSSRGRRAGSSGRARARRRAAPVSSRRSSAVSPAAACSRAAPASGRTSAADSAAPAGSRQARRQSSRRPAPGGCRRAARGPRGRRRATSRSTPATCGPPVSRTRSKPRAGPPTTEYAIARSCPPAAGRDASPGVGAAERVDATLLRREARDRRRGSSVGHPGHLVDRGRRLRERLGAWTRPRWRRR